MLYVKLENIRTVVKRVEELEKICIQVSKSRNYERRKEFEKNLNCVRDQKNKLCSENLLEDLGFSLGEKEMAYQYFYKGKEWKEAFFDSCIYEDMTEKEIEDSVLVKNRYETERKFILRRIRRYNPKY